MYKPPYNPLFDDPNNPRAAYNKRYRFLYYLSGLGMKVYNKVKYGLETDLYTRLFAHLVKKDGFDVTLSAPCTLYWDNEPLDEPYQVPMLINNNVIVDIYTQPLIAALERSRLEHRMSLTHTSYGVVINFAPDAFYSEWYHRDPDTGNVQMVKLI